MKTETPMIPKIEMNYGQLAKLYASELLQKMEHIDVTAQTACRIRQIVKLVKPAMETMKKTYLETIQAPHFEKVKEAGLDPTSDRKGLTPEQLEKVAELDRAVTAQTEEFEKTKVQFDLIPFGPQHFNEIKVSAADLEALGPLFDEGGEVRKEQFKKKFGVIPNPNN